ncbi:MAG: bifunctional adenosylcobinamide kinase/adenosylcobinamide-phosphate guanylyltransferase [Anaerolineales bacterium]|nr:bifunctional adenosylcobinamide kinase/adenosylcobinamide-phosphate guanylyltransferase [Anaerolineales bacterium]MDP3184532.1 bifunctional adenosylcobinamide kinase/adenosylcobinamide-phosphate guanylyltransferase [Anaerolineales bacterium]
MGKLILLLGGARSGKSVYAQQKATELGGDRVLYVATSEAKDKEMHSRIEKHRAARPSSWLTLEALQDVGKAIRQANFNVGVILVDCITILVSNRLQAAAGPQEDPFGNPSADPFGAKIEVDIMFEVEKLVACAREMDVVMIVVSNEVGMGLVPPYVLGRAYRDLLGRANQALARHADEVYLLVAGIPMRVK